ncbi:neurogenic locus protein delta [Phlebotomus papatasi]|uniref:neurogenic locus protein delta n=1 Tax=Phlebotomus papatasi TaxID=29031 RepID=UPI0024835935|nr:neurogenic locus protein delta [Phlebotomus papatasi]XP_055716840.1 neurogenic locus protein delta [Phlebotomus papatasi]XP_055716847.1 neurogenic locus protein delta [Phlebotomus papatasi]
MNWINITLALWILTISLVVQVESSGLFELRLKYFRNDNGRDNTGACCSGRSDSVTGKCIGTCKTRFRVCLKHYQAKIDTTSQCTFGDVMTPVLGENTINMTSQSQQIGFVNPIQFPFDFAWPGTFTLIVEAWHDTNETITRSPGILISRLSIQRVLDVSSNWTEDKHESVYTTIQYDFRVTCDAHYYGSGCANLCRPRDDQFGHYTCSATGGIVCLSGWQGDYCTKARCLPGCDEQHGHCNVPNQCVCQSGWKGELCDECEPYPGCMHGTCKKPWECRCNEGWGGLFCNQDLNYCTNHRPCQNGGTCFNTGQGSYTCQCAPGYTGTDCDIVISSCENSPCLNGATCRDETPRGYRCECRKGWTGKHCDRETVTCADKPCLHGKCRDTNQGFKCECPLGYSGLKCDTQVDECSPNPCMNGATCLNNGNSFHCQCPSGFAGKRCERNIDDCQGNPCLHGGTCIDMVNQFRCQCVPGYIGSLCENKVDLCLTKPCANGGTCTNLKNDYRCTCRAGFSGKDCSIDIDECASSPCRNGGTCVNRVNSFHCVCTSGFTGNQCEQEFNASAWDSANISRHVSSVSGSPEAHSGRSDELNTAQITLIVVFSVAMPLIVISAAAIVMCMKRKRKRAQEKDDAEARMQNEQNASHGGLAHHHNSMSSKRSSGSGLGLDATSHNMIKNTWDKSVNMSSSVSVDDCLLNASLYSSGVGPNFNTASGGGADVSECYGSGQMSPLQRARSQKQLNTDPLVMHRASQIISTSPSAKDFHVPPPEKRISVLSDATLCNTRWMPPVTRQMGPCSPPHM